MLIISSLCWTTILSSSMFFAMRSLRTFMSDFTLVFDSSLWISFFWSSIFSISFLFSKFLYFSWTLRASYLFSATKLSDCDCTDPALVGDPGFPFSSSTVSSCSPHSSVGSSRVSWACKSWSFLSDSSSFSLINLLYYKSLWICLSKSYLIT